MPEEDQEVAQARVADEPSRLPMRAQAMAALDQVQRCDVLIVGAGINGAATFWDLAQQGVSCVIVDAVDFGAGASSASTRMAHGGLRYLETGQFRLVSESTRERDRLLKNAAHYIRPIEVTIPLFSVMGGIWGSAAKVFGRQTRLAQRGLALVKTGLSIYDHLGRRSRALPRHRMRGGHAARDRFKGLHPAARGSATYYDAIISHAERVAVELVADGVRAGAAAGVHALNHCAVEGLADGAVLLHDRLGGRRFTLRPDLVVNAGGAWIDEVNARLGVQTQRIQGTKGSHLIVDSPALHRALDGSAFSWDDGEGRMCVMYPLGDAVLLGSTDIRVDDPEQAVCDADEVAYLLAAVRLVFPWIDLRESDIRFRFCGVRPLARSDQKDTVNISRDHSIAVEPPAPPRAFPILSLIGGKWTTFRAFAEQATDQVLATLGRGRRGTTADVPIGGATGLAAPGAPRDAQAQEIAARTGLDAARAAVLLGRYGTRAAAIAAHCAAPGAADGPLPDAADYSRREIDWIIRNEMAACLSDIFFRRSVLAVSGRLTPALIAAIDEILTDALGRDAPGRAEDHAAFLAELETRHGLPFGRAAA